MATKTIAWETGGGYITLTYTGTGDGPVSVQSDANELYEERQQTVRIVTTAGSPEKAVELLVKQKGKSYPVGTEFDFSYTGSVQEITLPPGKYKLQCWGAQGGSVSGSYAATGSKGGYSEGVLTVTEPTTIYVFVGGKGTDSSTSSISGTANGGWNGGGASTRYSSYSSGGTSGYSYPRPGGGATDMCLVTSSMGYSSGRTNRSSVSLLSRFIVAGGGAGASVTYRSEQTSTSSWKTVYSGNSSGYAVTAAFGGNYFFLKNVSCEVGKTYKFTGTNPSSHGLLGYTMEWYGASGYISATSSNSGTAPSGATSVTCYLVTNSTTSEGFSASDCQFTISVQETSTSTSTSSAKSNSAQQGGGTNGKGQYPGTQSSAGSGGAFGLGANQTTTNYRHDSGAGGGGWYGGGCGHSDSSTSYVNYGGGGSGFVNTAANASYRPSGYTGLQLDSGTTTAGNTSHLSPSGGTETGHSGDGYARITVLEN